MNFSIPGPEYLPSSSFGSFYGDNINLCIWYGGKFENKEWWFNSDFLNLCPNCFKKVFPKGYKGHVSDKELKNIFEKAKWRGPMNWDETVKQIKNLYITDNILFDMIEFVVKTSINIVFNQISELGQPIDSNLIIPIAKHFWLFGNAFYNPLNKIVYNFEDIHWKDGKYFFKSEIGYSFEKREKHLLHLKRLVKFDDIFGTPLPIINNKDLTLMGFNTYHPNELFKSIQSEIKKGI